MVWFKVTWTVLDKIHESTILCNVLMETLFLLMMIGGLASEHIEESASYD